FAYLLHNRVMPADVTGDNNVWAEDALNVINYINAKGSGPIVARGEFGSSVSALAAVQSAAQYYDVTGDDYIGPDDVLAVINYINAHNPSQTQMPAGEAAAQSNDLLILLASDVASQTTRRK